MEVPYQRHQKAIQQQGKLQSSSNTSLNVLKDKPFWIWDKQEHLKLAIETNQQCCAQHIIGLPRKNSKEYPLFDYEKLIFDAIENNQNIWILKSRGIGVTTFMIRYFAWKILSSSELDNKSIFIVSDTREEHANYIKEKLEQLFENFIPPVNFESKYTELLLKKTWIKVFPTKNIKDIRGYFEASYIFVDESDYLEESIQDELMHAISPYEEKSNCKIILCSTPFKPLGLMQRIENDVNSKYVKLKFDYRYGLDKIYDRNFIESKKLEAEFEREYNLKYLGKIGNTFSYKDIDRAIELGNTYDADIVSMDSQFSMGLDSGFGSSAFGLVLLEFINGQIHVKIAEEYSHVRYEDICSKIKSILTGLNQCSINQTELAETKIYIDSSAPEFVRSLKVMVGEYDNPIATKEQLDFCKKYDMNPADYMRVIPISFNPEAKNMLIHTKELLEYEARPLIGINSKFDKLITALRTAVSDDMGRLDKESTSYDDVMDAFRLALRHFRIKNKNKESKPIILLHDK